MSCGQVDRYGGMPQGGILPRPGEVGQTGKGGGGQSWPAGEGPASGPDQNGIDGSNGQGTPCNGCGGGNGGGGGSGSGSGSSPGVGGANGANGANGPGGATAPGAKGASSPNGKEQELIDAINQARAAVGLSPVTQKSNLSTEAQQNDAANNRTGKLDHHVTGQGPQITAMFDAGSGGDMTAAQAVKQWTESAGHAAIMFDPNLKFVGASIDGDFTTASFS
jgi:hypothetical protein